MLSAQTMHLCEKWTSCVTSSQFTAWSTLIATLKISRNKSWLKMKSRETSETKHIQLYYSKAFCPYIFFISERKKIANNKNFRNSQFAVHIPEVNWSNTRSIFRGNQKPGLKFCENYSLDSGYLFASLIGAKFKQIPGRTVQPLAPWPGAQQHLRQGQAERANIAVTQ